MHSNGLLLGGGYDDLRLRMEGCGGAEKFWSFGPKLPNLPPYRRVWYGVGPDLICQLSPSPAIKTRSSSAVFPTTLSLPFILFPSSLLACTAPLMSQAALSS